MNNTKRKNESKFNILLKKYRGTSIELDLSRYKNMVEDISRKSYSDLSDDSIRSHAIAHARSLREMRRNEPVQRERLDDILPSVYSLAAEGARRKLGLDPFREQLIAAIAMHEGKLVQMQTGEGKTLAAAITATLDALTGAGVHILTANEYLAKRDTEWMGPIYRLFGLQVAYIAERMTPEEKREAYASDITYLTAKQAGFDFLYDTIHYDPRKRVQREFSMCIVDEADFIMIDEARIPLVIAKESESSRADPVSANRIAVGLQPELHFEADRRGRVCVLTIEGQKEVQRAYSCGGMHEHDSAPFYAAVNVALHAHHLLSRGVDYIVRSRRIELVDEFTGRIADKRKWPYGIQTALAVKEHLIPEREGSVCGSITVQHFLGQYPIVAAMTATAIPAAEEFSTFYKLTTVVIPPHRPDRMIRLDDRVFATRSAKLDALVEEIRTVNATRRPILVGTQSVRESMELSQLLNSEGIEHKVLNAENDEEEAPIIARAGIPGAVTISTNMAGRGTDIRLGEIDGEYHDEVADLGGLYIIGTNRHESVRIDNQLLGRAARQGDPGSGRFYVSLEDPLISHYAITELIPPEFFETESPVEERIFDKRVVREIDRAQEIIEGQHFEMRRTLRRYTEIIEKQRTLIFDIREDALANRLLPNPLIDRCRDTFDRVEKETPDFDTEEVLSLLFINEIDEFWMDHLMWVDSTREGIHLRRLGKRDPLLDYLTDATNAFDEGMDRLIERTADRFDALVWSPEEIGALKTDLLGPSSTWTYMINDNPFPSFRISLLGVGPGAEAAGALASAVAAPFILLYSLYRGMVKLLSSSRRANENDEIGSDGMS